MRSTVLNLTILNLQPKKIFNNNSMFNYKKLHGLPYNYVSGIKFYKQRPLQFVVLVFVI